MATPVGDSYRGGMLTRAFRRETWRELWYLTAGLGTSAAAFTLVVAGATVGGILALTIVGLPVLLAIAHAFRRLADLERRRIAWLLRRPIEGLYRPWSGRLLARTRRAWSDPQVWKDFGWHVVNSVLGFGFGVAALSLWASVGWLLTLPLYWWALPHAALPNFGADWFVDRWSRVLLLLAGGLLGLVLVPWICAALASGHARLGRAFLAASGRTKLERRVSELAETRAAAADAQTEELRRIERDLHDGAQARLVALAIDLGLAKEKFEADPAAARLLVESAHGEAKGALKELRELVRGVHPAVLEDRGLDGALSGLVARSAIPVRLEVEVPGRLPPAVETAAYFLVAEALANMAKHSRAARGEVRLVRADELLVIEVTDDGVGGAAPASGSGLAGLEGRIRALDGELLVSSPAGGPTTLHAELPCGS
jgi:signal transduction histidine kinase